MPLPIPTSILSRWKLIAVGLAVVIAFYAGWKRRDLTADLAMAEYQKLIIEERAKAEHEARRVEQLTLENTGLALQAAAKRATRRELQINEVEKEVVRYEKIPVATDCGPDIDWVLIHDASASRGVPKVADAAARNHAAAAEITNADTLRVVTRNYSEYQRVADELMLCQDFVTGVWDAYNKKE